MSPRRVAWNTKKGESAGFSAGTPSQTKLDSSITVLAIEQALAELGIRARLSEIIENGIIQRVRSMRRSKCAG